MRKNNFFLFFVLTLNLAACGTERPAENAEGTEPTCQNGAFCSEADLNAPVPGTREEAFDPATALPAAPRSLAIPEFKDEWGLHRAIYDKAVQYYNEKIAEIPNPRYITLIDFSKHSRKQRFFLFDLEEGTVDRHVVSHGSGSDPDRDGDPTLFSNEINSRKSSLGFYLTLGTYQGKNGYSMRIRGLSETNSNAEKRAVVVHPARYVKDDGSRNTGLSWGCPALDPKISRGVINKIKNGSLMLIDRQ